MFRDLKTRYEICDKFDKIHNQLLADYSRSTRQSSGTGLDEMVRQGHATSRRPRLSRQPSNGESSPSN